jgi:hypothetical protein
MSRKNFHSGKLYQCHSQENPITKDPFFAEKASDLGRLLVLAKK